MHTGIHLINRPRLCTVQCTHSSIFMNFHYSFYGSGAQPSFNVSKRNIFYRFYVSFTHVWAYMTYTSDKPIKIDTFSVARSWHSASIWTHFRSQNHIIETLLGRLLKRFSWMGFVVIDNAKTTDGIWNYSRGSVPFTFFSFLVQPNIYQFTIKSVLRLYLLHRNCVL